MKRPIPYGDYANIEAVVKTLCAGSTSLTAVLYRFVAPKYADPNALLSGEGAYLYGGRWNWPHMSRAIYGSFEPGSALAEADSHAQRLGVKLAVNLPRTLAAFTVQLSYVLDFTPPALQAQLGLASDLLSVPWQRAIDEGWEAITHAVGRAAFEAGVEAIKVPCAPRPGVPNLVIFRENLASTSTVTYGVSR